jgi:hypothetical protein
VTSVPPYSEHVSPAMERGTVHLRVPHFRESGMQESNDSISPDIISSRRFRSCSTALIRWESSPALNGLETESNAPISKPAIERHDAVRKPAGEQIIPNHGSLCTSNFRRLKFLVAVHDPYELRADPTPPAACFHLPANGAFNDNPITFPPGYSQDELFTGNQW